MSAMSTIEIALKQNHIPEGMTTERFISSVASCMKGNKVTVEEAIEHCLPFFAELCGDCLLPAQWNESRKCYTCDRCGA